MTLLVTSGTEVSAERIQDALMIIQRRIAKSILSMGSVVMLSVKEDIEPSVNSGLMDGVKEKTIANFSTSEKAKT